LYKARGQLLSVFLKDRGTLKFALGVILGLSFSIAVILSTVGIMDGFEFVLKKGLKKSFGDLTLISSDGFFLPEKKVKSSLNSLNIISYSPLVQTEGFLIYSQLSQGVQIKGIDLKTFPKITGLSLDFKRNEVAIGVALAKKFRIKKGDRIVLAFASGNKRFSGRPLLKGFKVGQIVSHGLHQKDKRLIYVKRRELDLLMGLKGQVNVVSLKLPAANLSKGEESLREKEIVAFVRRAENILEPQFYLRPYWEEFQPLLEAVKHEKFIITLILQLVVVISIFNVVAFIFFINEKKSKEIFLFRAMGMDKKSLTKVWLFIVFFFWFFSCLLSIAFLRVFDWLLQVLPFFKLPGDIYNFERLKIVIDSYDYLMVFLAALFWFLLFAWFTLLRVGQKNILAGLRKEFS
jgi:ABC-type lipoprotein release transport system permease subunit